MKKSLVLAMAMALGVTASAYAANPFSDVPAGHWAYDSIDKLAAAGVIDGMGDGTFQGDKTMTRYEMAQIVAKAMAKGANVDKLAAEFADELDALGVRVANLEKKSDNVKISGTIKLRSWGYHGSAAVSNKTNHNQLLRSDLKLKGQINEDWTYTMMVRNEQKFSNDNAGKSETNLDVKEAYVSGKLGGVKVDAGRVYLLLENGDIFDDRADAVVASYGKDIKVTAAYGQYDKSTGKADNAGDSQFAFGRLDAKFGVVGAHVGYYDFQDLANVKDNSNIWAVGLSADITKSVNAWATYYKTDVDEIEGKDAEDQGFTVAVNYKGAKPSKPGSYGLSAAYYQLPQAVVVAHTMEGYWPVASEDIDGFKGWKVGGNLTLAKNIVAGVNYYGLEGKSNGKNYDTLYGELKFLF